MADLILDNPYTLEESVRRPYADEDTVGRTLDAAHKAAQAWGRTSVEERVALCERAVQEMESAREGIAADITRMMGKPLKQARNEVTGMAKRARFMISIAESSLADTVLPPLSSGGSPTAPSA
jgi:acyl-CoA reductase-like NAD-dependent aldehyde dehydrogenase